MHSIIQHRVKFPPSGQITLSTKVKGIGLVVLLLSISVLAQSQSITLTGSVRDAESRSPLPYVNIIIQGTGKGGATNERGSFKLEIHEQLNPGVKLIASSVGYQTDTIAISSSRTSYNFFLSPSADALNEVVVVSGTMKEVSKLDSPIPVEIYTPALFIKNPTPSIFESLSMINGVQPQLNCNVCNTGDIHINGMEGPYTMILIDGMPIVSSLATVYGLSGIPNSMVKRIEVVKGPASTLYGSEAVGGLINIITKDPETSPRLKIDAFGTTFGEFNIDFSTKWKTKNTQSLLGLNYFNFSNRVDVNDDNFTDVTLQNRISLFNKWSFSRTANRQASVAFRYVLEDRWGGEMNWEKKYRGSDQVYGETINTNRIELIGNYQLPLSQENINLDFSYNYHLQDSYYGTVKYLANQHVAFTQLRWDKKISNHDMLIGLPFRFVHYDDNTPGTSTADSLNQPMQTYLLGVFIQDEIALTSKTKLLAGIRYDYHNVHQNIISPRLSLKFSPSRNSALRLSVGNGFRVINLFTEDHAALTGAREVIVEEELKPEESWNGNINYTIQVPHRKGYINLDGSLFYTYFSNKIVGDFFTDPELIIYNNLDGHAVSRGATINTEFSFTSSLKFIAGVTLMDVFQVERDSTNSKSKSPQLFAPRVSGTYSLSYTFDRSGLTVDLTGRLNGPMYLPVVPNDFRPEKSPWFTIINIQVTKTVGHNIEIYGGLKNLLNFIPKDPLLRPFDPFDKNITVNNPAGYTFDTSYNYAPVQGIRGFFGIRYTLF